MEPMQSQASDQEINSLVDQAYRRIQSLFDYYQLSSADYDLFAKESPALIDAINKVEETTLLSYQDMRVVCHKWIENHHLLFKRRVYFKRI
jgi:hypothetical protein